MVRPGNCLKMLSVLWCAAISTAAMAQSNGEIALDHTDSAWQEERATNLRGLAEASRVKDWAIAESLALELFAGEAAPADQIYWLERAADAMKNRVISLQPSQLSANREAELLSARALREEAIQLRPRADWSESMLGSLARLLCGTASIAETMGDSGIAMRWYEEAASEVARAPADMQSSLERFGVLPDDLLFHAARNALAIGDMDAVRRCLGAIDGLPVKRRGSGFHATSIVDQIAKSDRLAAFRFAREWYERPTTEERQPMTSRIASYAMSLLDRGDAQEMREAANYLAQVMVRDRAMIEAEDKEGERNARERIGRARPLLASERQIVSAQFLYSRVMLEGAARSTIAPQLAREFVQRYPKHGAIDSVRQILNGN